jgi:beta-glucanase (GH16 family)
MDTPLHGKRLTWYKAALLLALAGGTLLALALPAGTGAHPSSQATFTQIWNDEFDGTGGVNSANWLYDLGTGYPGSAPNWGTGEIETMTNSTSNVFRDGSGHLVIRALHTGTNPTTGWTSGRIETQRNDFQPPAGGVLAVEGRLQQPNLSGAAAAGYWPAFWMLGGPFRGNFNNWPSVGEIDLMEDINGRSSEFATFHCGSSPGGPCNENSGIGSGERACGGCQTGFHTYRMEWDKSITPNQLRWFLDGAQFFTVNANQVDANTWNNATNHGYMIILDLAMGGGFPAAFGGGPTASTVSGGSMVVDYVRVFQRGGGGGGPTATPTRTPTPQPGGTRDAYSTIQAESFNAQSGTQVENTTDTGGGQNVGFIANGDFLVYNNVNFGATAPRQVNARVASGAAGGVSGLVEFHIDSQNGPLIGSFSIANTGGWQSWRTVPANSGTATGVHTVFVVFRSGQPADFVNVNWFVFTH